MRVSLRLMYAFLICAFSFALSQPAEANTRYWRLPSDSYASEMQGYSTLWLYFNPSDKCEEEYGDDSYSVCMGGNKGLPLAGKPGEGISITPPVEGTWVWNSSSSIEFTPTPKAEGGGWEPGTTYTVKFSPASFPPGLELDDYSYTVKAMPLKAESLQAKFLFNRQTLKDLVLTATINFTYPVKRDSVRFRFDTANVELAKELTAVWNADNTQVVFSQQVLRLPDNPGDVTANLQAGYKSQAFANVGRETTLGSGEFFGLNIPGKNTIFRVEEASASIASMPDLKALQSVVLMFSLDTKGQDVHKAVTAKLLPRQRVQLTGTEKDTRDPYTWWNFAEITEDVLANSADMPLTLLAGSPDPTLAAMPSQSVALGFEAEPGRCLLVTVPAGIMATSGVTTREARQFILEVPETTSTLEITQDGNILPRTGQGTLSLYSHNIDTVDYTLYRVRPEFVNIFVSSNYDMFSHPYRYMDWDQFSVIAKGSIPIKLEKPSLPQFSVLNLAPHVGEQGSGIFYVKLEGKRNGELLTESSRFVLYTDMGLFYKKSADGSGDVFVVSLSTGEPKDNVTVQVIGANGVPVFEGKSEKGRVTLPSLLGLQFEKEPVALVAYTAESAGGLLGGEKVPADMAYLPLNSLSYELETSYSKFQTGGNRSAVDGINAYMFTSRGIYRPGDQVEAAFMVHQGPWEEASAKALAGIPLQIQLTDPAGEVLVSQAYTLSPFGMEEWKYRIPQNARMGRYTIDLTLIGAKPEDRRGVLASSSFILQEFEADTMQLALTLNTPEPKGWYSPKDLKLESTLSNLFGTPATGKRIDVVLNTSIITRSFASLPEWNFTVPYQDGLNYAQSELNLPSLITDEKGQAVFQIPDTTTQPEMYALVFNAEAFDGGKSVRNTTRAYVSSLPFLMGTRGESYIPQNTKAQAFFLPVDQNLAIYPSVGKVQASLSNTINIKTLVQDNNGLYKYENTAITTPISSKEINFPTTIPQEGFPVDLDTSTPGDKILELKDAKGRLLTRFAYHVSGEAVAQFGEKAEATMLMRLNKQDYTPGETVEVSLTLPYAGTGLITLEREKVYTAEWFTAEAGSLTRSITIPAGLEGRAYINVAFFRSLKDSRIFMEPLANSVMPLTVNMDNLNLKLNIQAPQKVLPGSSFDITVQTVKPAKAIVYAIDEGILSLTDYATPNPAKIFLENRALEVDTSQYLSLLMPEYSRIQNALAAFGGGNGLALKALGSQNPFSRKADKPAVFWSGLLDVGPEASQVSIPVPPTFNGSLRIMGVAMAPTGLASANVNTLVQANVVITSHVPLFAAPGDVFTATFTLTLMDDAFKGKTVPVVLELIPEEGLDLGSTRPFELQLEYGKAQTVHVPVTATKALGPTTLTANATITENKAVSSMPVSLSVRPATPNSRSTLMGFAKNGSVNEQNLFKTPLYPQFARVQTSTSPYPVPILQALTLFVEKYPYYCTEQLLSAAFPSIFLPEDPAINAILSPERRKERLSLALASLAARQASSGYFSAWGDSSWGSDWISVYAGDFLVSMKEKGYAIPSGLEHDSMNWLESYASTSPSSKEDATLKAYAAWVLSRNGVVTSGIVGTLVPWLDKYNKGWEKELTGSFIGACMRSMMQDEAALRLINAWEPSNSYNFPFTPITSRALYLSVLAQTFPKELNAPKAIAIQEELVASLTSNPYNTFEAALGIRGLMARAITDFSTTEQVLTGQEAANFTQFSVKQENPFYWMISREGFQTDPFLPAIQNGMQISKTLSAQDATALKDSTTLGENIWVTLTANAYGDPVDDVAICDLFPAGFTYQDTSNTPLPETLGKNPKLSVAYTQVYEDRICIFTALGTESGTFSYSLRAAYPGEFVNPAATMEAMYQPALAARSIASKIIVKE